MSEFNFQGNLGLFNISIFNTFPETQMKSNSNTPVVLSRTFVLVENHPEVIRFTETRYGVTPSLLLMVFYHLRNVSPTFITIAFIF
jgi:hypothetical protein